MRLRIALERDEDGMWVAECPALPGCISRWHTPKEALDHINDAIEGFLTGPETHREPTPSGDSQPYRSVEERKDDDDHEEEEDHEDDPPPNPVEITSGRECTMAKYVKEPSPCVMRDAEVRMFDMVSRLKDDIEQLYEEMEILLNRDMLPGVEKSRQEMKRGELYGWESFKEIVDE